MLQDLAISEGWRGGDRKQPSEIVDGIRTLRALLKDGVLDNNYGNASSSPSGAGSSSASTTSSSGSSSGGRDVMQGAWGPNSMTIRREVQRLGDALSLPSLAKLQIRRSGASMSTVMQGSLLPSANQQLKSMTSCISGRRIQGTAVSLKVAGTKSSNKFASINEVYGWKRVNPFSPLMTGEFLET